MTANTSSGGIVFSMAILSPVGLGWRGLEKTMKQFVNIIQNIRQKTIWDVNFFI